MVSGAILRQRTEDPIDFECADQLAFEKGAILAMDTANSREVSGAVLIGAPCAGILAREKIANDGRTRVAMFQRGVFSVVASGAIKVGDPVSIAGGAVEPANENSTGDASGARIIGHALETAAHTEYFQIKLTL